MTPDGLEDRFQLAQVIAREAGAHALGYFGDRRRLTVEAKTNAQDVVSVADREVETLLGERIKLAFPGDGTLGEEYGLSGGTSGYTWVMDPIDGTSAFVHGLSDWCVSIALLHGQELAAGVIYAPVANELYAASTGQGATLDGAPLSVSPGMGVADGLVGIGANHRVPPERVSGFIHRLLGEGGMFVRGGSGALTLAHVAAGRLVAFFEPHMNAWDCLAGYCLVREAGGWTWPFRAETDLLTGNVVVAAAPGARNDILRLIAADRPAAGNGSP